MIIEVQDVDQEVVHEPIKDVADHSDLLSTHPLSDTGDQKTKKIIRWKQTKSTLCCYANQKRNRER